MKKKLLQEQREKAIIENFAKTFNSIKRVDENEIGNYTSKEVIEQALRAENIKFQEMPVYADSSTPAFGKIEKTNIYIPDGDIYVEFNGETEVTVSQSGTGDKKDFDLDIPRNPVGDIIRYIKRMQQLDEIGTKDLTSPANNEYIYSIENNKPIFMYKVNDKGHKEPVRITKDMLVDIQRDYRENFPGDAADFAIARDIPVEYITKILVAGRYFNPDYGPVEQPVDENEIGTQVPENEFMEKYPVGSQFKDAKYGAIKTIKKYENGNAFIEDENMQGRLFQWPVSHMNSEVMNKKLIPV